MVKSYRFLLVAALVAGCSGTQSETAQAQQAAMPGAAPSGPSVCEIVDSSRPIADAVRETSGLARSVRNPDVFWIHNDSGNAPDLFAIGADGNVVQRVRVGAAELVDWEDIEAGPCPGGSCLYIADTGDNAGIRKNITIYRIEEPAAGASQANATAFHARYPDGPRDAEALFADTAGNLYVVTKGRQKTIELYRLAGAQQAGQTVTLSLIRELFPQPSDPRDWITSAASTPDGRWIGIRSYRNLYIYEANALLSGNPVKPTIVSLEPLAEIQGEALAMANDGHVWLTSEAESRKAKPVLSRMRCTYPGS